MAFSRRNFAKNTLAATAAIGLPSALAASNNPTAKKLKLVCVGGHPDDPESGCGGTLAKFRAEGHDVTVIYLTTGEAGISGVTHKSAADIRRKEAMAACAVLDAKSIFAG